MKGFIYTKANRAKVRRGQKWQTRRLVKPQPEHLAWDRFMGKLKPRYWVGDICYMREPFCFHVGLDKYTPKEIACRLYPGQRGEMHFLDDGPKPDWAGRTRSSMFLPAAFARTFKRVTEVRCERLQDISDEDCFAEGITAVRFTPRITGYTYPGASEGQMWGTPQQAYEAEIVALHGREVWDGNAWVWVYVFQLCDREGRQ